MPRKPGLSQGPQAASRLCAQESSGDRGQGLKQRNSTQLSALQGAAPLPGKLGGSHGAGRAFLSLLTGRP